MATIVGIHGIGQQFVGPYALRSAWFDALRDGLITAKYADGASELTELDIDVAFFGDLFRSRFTDEIALSRIRQGPRRSDVASDILMALYEEAVTAEPDLLPPGQSMGGGRLAAQKALSVLLRSRALTRATEPLLMGSLRQVSRFLTDEDTKIEVFERLSKQITPDTKIVVAHSLGSVVAYEYLCKFAPSSVRQLITLGSPLGMRNLIFDRLTPRPITEKAKWPGKAKWPARVESWVNVSDPDDIVALRKRLAPLFPTDGAGVLFDCSVDNGNEPHSSLRYLSTVEVGTAIGSTLTSE